MSSSTKSDIANQSNKPKKDKGRLKSTGAYQSHPPSSAVSLAELPANASTLGLRQEAILQLQRQRGNAFTRQFLNGSIGEARTSTSRLSKPSRSEPEIMRQSGTGEAGTAKGLGDMVTIGEDGALLANGERIGAAPGGDTSKAVITVGEDGKTIALMSDSQIGILNIWLPLAIYRVARARLKPVSGREGVFEVTPRGRAYGAIWSGEKVTNSVSGKVLDPKKQPPLIKNNLQPSESKLKLKDGGFWVYMEFAYKGERKRSGRWVPSGKSMSHIRSRGKELSDEAAKLPDGEMKEKIEQYLPLMTAVSAHEGSFGAKSPGSDPMASLGIFQWGARKAENVSRTSSLYRFFRDLYDRAQEAQAAVEAGEELTGEQQLYQDSWQQCRNRGLNFAGNNLTLNGRPVTGKKLEQHMKGAMASDSLRTYQLVASLDWIEKFKQTVIRPGPVGKSKIGNGYTEPRGSNGGRMVQLSKGKVKIQVTADSHPTVGDVFPSVKDLSKAVILGVNRPHYVETALWQALGSDSPKSETAAEMAIIHREIRAAVREKRLPRKSVYNEADINAIGDEAQAAYMGLKFIIWPDVAGADLSGLIGEFEARAMQLYKASDAKNFKRERRFATVEAIFD